MKGKDELTHFKKMWTWLMAYPTHDREYYIQHVADQAEEWHNNCPLSNSKYAENCTGCHCCGTAPKAPCAQTQTLRSINGKTQESTNLTSVLSMPARLLCWQCMSAVNWSVRLKAVSYARQPPSGHIGYGQVIAWAFMRVAGITLVGRELSARL